MNWIVKIFHFILKSLVSIIFLIFIVIAGGVSAFVIYQNVYSVPDTVVPSVIGEELKVAQEKLYNAGLQIKVSSDEFDEKISSNKIITQDPASGSKVKKNREIYVVVSKGSKAIVLNIPDLRNKELKEATAIIEEYGLTLGKVTYTNHFSVPQDQVIAQVPEPGDISTKNKTVNLLVSKGHY
jgi:serine/threonine-protein kinase